ncbi:MAG: ATP-grasp domain-containing protein [Gemmatimonadales bacterium]|nr:ATP-grasp domain-containing protein [Gemmatimonadales bacterium]
MAQDVAVAAASARALAQAARRAGYRVAAVDAYGDLDLRQVVGDAYVRLRPWDATAAVAALANRAATRLVAYGTGLEHEPAAVRALAKERELLGNPPSVLAAAGDPLAIAAALAEAGVPGPMVRASAPAVSRAKVKAPGPAWLLKPRASGGGRGITDWARGTRVGRTHYLQERLDGPSGSLVFLADGRRAMPLALSRQLVGDAAFGAAGYRWCGNLLATADAPLFDEQERLLHGATRAADALTKAFGLVGVNGIDFIAQDGAARVVELNPRWTAAAELIERARELPLFELHVRACRGVLLPASRPPLDLPLTYGKAVVFALRSGVTAGTAAWLGDRRFADVPANGTPVAVGDPVCTVFAEADTAKACHDQLLALARLVHHAVGRPIPAPA